jgi:two-component system, OmpR family, KDP operon response regulator KdpE
MRRHTEIPIGDLAVASHEGEQPLAPHRHGPRAGHDRRVATHDVHGAARIELQALLVRQPQRCDGVRLFHESVARNDPVNTRRQRRYAEAATAREAISWAQTQRPDLIIADLGLPDGDAGADDYVTKPFATGELLARLRAALRRALPRQDAGEPTAFTVRDLHVDLAHRRVTLCGAEVHLTPIEYRLLTTLIAKAGQVVTHAELLRAAWGPAKLDQQHYLRIYMAGLRRKLEADPAQPIYLLTETGVGYRLIDE